jgi:hypothetical protein
MVQRRSKRHVEVYEKLLELYPGIKVKEEYHIGQKLLIDMVLTDMSIGIEINGQQHYELSEFFHKGSELAFNRQLLNDKKKRRLCKESSMFLYAIPYDDERTAEELIREMLAQAAVYFDSVSSEKD